MRKEIMIERALTGYDDKPTQIKISRKYEGTYPNIEIRENGQYEGKLILSEGMARELIDALECVLK